MVALGVTLHQCRPARGGAHGQAPVSSPGSLEVPPEALVLIQFHDVALLPLVSRLLVAAGWVWFFIFFVFRREPAGAGGVKRERVSNLGILLQMLSFALVWMIQRPQPAAGARLDALEIARDVLAPVLGLASVWIGLTAVRTLGRQWSYEARVIEGHQLVTAGLPSPGCGIPSTPPCSASCSRATSRSARGWGCPSPWWFSSRHSHPHPRRGEVDARHSEPLTTNTPARSGVRAVFDLSHKTPMRRFPGPQPIRSSRCWRSFSQSASRAPRTPTSTSRATSCSAVRAAGTTSRSTRSPSGCSSRTGRTCRWWTRRPTASWVTSPTRRACTAWRWRTTWAAGSPATAGTRA